MTNLNTACEREHDFTLILDDVGEVTEELENRLFEAGCDDATFAIRCGRPVLTFSRIAPSMKDAILSALNDIDKAGLRAIRVDYCNLVSQADIARRMGRSRQLVHQYMTGSRGPGNFPGPVCEICDGQFLWMWCEVAYWLWENNIIKEDVLRDADAVDAINNVLGMRYRRTRRPELMEEVMSRIGNA